jgi:hypothetical protein
MSSSKRPLKLFQPARYEIRVVGHLSSGKATWFEGFCLTNQIDQDGNPVTVLTGQVLDQAMLHGLLTRIRDLGLPLLNVVRVENDESATMSTDGS